MENLADEKLARFVENLRATLDIWETDPDPPKREPDPDEIPRVEHTCESSGWVGTLYRNRFKLARMTQRQYRVCDGCRHDRALPLVDQTLAELEHGDLWMIQVDGLADGTYIVQDGETWPDVVRNYYGRNSKKRREAVKKANGLEGDPPAGAVLHMPGEDSAEYVSRLTGQWRKDGGAVYLALPQYGYTVLIHNRPDVGGKAIPKDRRQLYGLFWDLVIQPEDRRIQPSQDYGRDQAGSRRDAAYRQKKRDKAQDIRDYEGWADVNATESAVILAAEYQIDLTTLDGSGADGRILKDDVLAEIDARRELARADGESVPAPVVPFCQIYGKGHVKNVAEAVNLYMDSRLVDSDHLILDSSGSGSAVISPWYTLDALRTAKIGFWVVGGYLALEMFLETVSKPPGYYEGTPIPEADPVPVAIPVINPQQVELIL